MLAIVTSHPIQYQAPLWRELAEAKIDCEVWFLTPHAVEASFDREFEEIFAWDLDLLKGYPHRFLPIKDGWRMNRFNGVRLASDWAVEFRKRNVTHLWVEGWRFLEFWQAIRAAHRNGIKIWLRGETTDLARRRGVREVFRRAALRWLFRRVSSFLCVGTANRRFYLSHGVPVAKLRPAPYGVDNARFRQAAAELRPRRAYWRARWNIAPHAIVLLFCGKLIAKKRPLDLLAAAHLAAPCMARPLHLLFAGDGGLAPEVRAALARGKVPGTITGFLNQTEIPAAYVAADCLVLPSDAGETWGLVVNEALACGLPVIVSDRCGCAEDLAQPFGNQHVFACGDLATLASNIIAVTATPSDAEMQEKIVAAHTPRRTVETVRAILATETLTPT
jgi:glycosyltransferase involved in cell wall biosynthesis